MAAARGRACRFATTKPRQAETYCQRLIVVRFLGYQGNGMQVVSAVAERHALVPRCCRWICFALPIATLAATRLFPPAAGSTDFP